MDHLEGRQSVLAALKAFQRRFQVILVRRGMHPEKVQEVLELAAARGVPIRYAEAAELDALAHGATHGGVLAICTPKPKTRPAELLELLDRITPNQREAQGEKPAPGDAAPPECPLLLLLEGIDDARNLGFTLRSADALGVQAVLIKKHLWDFDPVEIARPAAGAFERLPLVQVDDLELLRQLQRRGLRLIGCLAGAKHTLYETDLTGPTILAIGGEKRGISGAVRAICDAFMTIPTRDDASSLALSHAASIAIAEALRQRLTARRAAAASGPRPPPR